MKVIRVLEKTLEAALGMQAVVEPSNAIARKEVRVMFNGIRGLNRLSTAAQRDYVPYEMLVDVVISARISGGNTRGFLASQQMQLNLCMTDYLTNDLIVLKNIGEALPVGFGDLSERLTIVGDAELLDTRKVASGWSEPKRDDDFDHKDDLFVWREDWHATLELTVHKHFINPNVREITSVNQLSGESSTITNEDN